MADASGGRIVWHLDIEDSGFAAKAAAAEQAAKRTGAGVASAGKAGFAGFATQASTAFGQVATGLGTVVKSAAVAGGLVALALGSAAKASFNTVRGVQSSTIALKAYTGSAKEAGQITKSLIKYARSDVGILFNRKELLFAAQSLAGYGAESSKVTGFVKIMSRAVATGNTTFEELAPILGRIGAAGQLTSVDFDVLTGRGIILDKKMRGAKVTFEELFAAVSKAIPASILDQQAKTVEGAVIRLKTSFRELGDQLLGTKYEDPINQLGASFKPGGLGDQIVKGVKRITDTFRSPEVTGSLGEFGQQLGAVAGVAIPFIIQAIKFLANNLDNLSIGLASLTTGFLAARAAAIGFSVAASVAQAGKAGKFLLMASAVIVLVIAITALLLKLGLLDDVIDGMGKAFAKAKSYIDMFVDGFVSGFSKGVPKIKESLSTLKDTLISLGDAFGKLSEKVGPLLPSLREVGTFLGGAVATGVNILIQGLNLLANAALVVTNALIWLVNGIRQGNPAAIALGVVLGAILIPSLIRLGVGATIAAAKMVGSFIMMAARAVLTSATVIASNLRMSLSFVGLIARSALTATMFVANMARMALSAVAQGARIALVFTVQMIAPMAMFAARMALTAAAFVASWVLMGAQAMLNAARIAIAWIIALGPIAWIIAAVIALAAIIILNWKKIWAFIGPTVTAIWNTVKNAFQAIYDFVKPIVMAIVTFVIAYVKAFVNTWKAVWNTVKAVASAVWKAIGPIVRVAIQFIGNTIRNGVNTIKAVWNGIKAVYNTAKDIFDKVVNFIKSVPGKIKGVGRDIAHGIADGLRSAGGAILDALIAIIPAPIRKFLKIDSPSKLMAAIVGVPIVQGIAQGIMQGGGAVVKAVRSVVSDASAEIPSTLGASKMGINGSMGLSGASMEIDTAGGVSGVSNTEIKVDVTGIYARSRQDMREVGKDILESINEEMRSRRLPEIGGGNLAGVTSA